MDAFFTVSIAYFILALVWARRELRSGKSIRTSRR